MIKRFIKGDASLRVFEKQLSDEVFGFVADAFPAVKIEL